MVGTGIGSFSDSGRFEVRVVPGTEDVRAGKKCPHCGAWMTVAQVYYCNVKTGDRVSESFLGYLCPHHGAVNEAGESLLR